MYKLNTSITFDDGLTLEQPEWHLHIVNDDIPNSRVHVNVQFTADGARCVRGMCIHEYTGTWNDDDLYYALLALPELANSYLI